MYQAPIPLSFAHLDALEPKVRLWLIFSSKRLDFEEILAFKK
jgi:hypothetical protein